MRCFLPRAPGAGREFVKISEFLLETVGFILTSLHSCYILKNS